MSVIGRGWGHRQQVRFGGDHPNLSFRRLVDDALAYVENIGQPAGLVGSSGGAGLALAVAAQSRAVHALPSVEPNTPRLMDEQE